MADLIAWMSDIFSVELGTIGTTTVTLGLILTLSLVAGLVINLFRRIRGRG